MRQVRTAAVDQIDARQVIGLGNLLRAQMLFDGHGVVRATLHRRVVADDHTLAPRNTTDPANQTRAGNLAVVKVIGRKLADFQKWRARIKQAFDALARQ